MKFVKNAGPESGALARVLPVIGVDREMIRLQQERLPPFSVSLEGVKTILRILEEKFAAYGCSSNAPVVLSFTESELLSNYRVANDINTAPNRVDREFNHLRTTAPPGDD